MPFTDQQIEQFQSYGQEACQEAIGAMTPEQQADLAQSVQAYNERKAGKQPDAIQGFVSSGVPVGHAASVATGAAPDNGPVVQQRQPELDQFMQATKIPYGLGGPSGQTVSEQNTQLQAQGKAPLADWQRDLQDFQLSNGAMTQKRSDNALWLDPSKGDASRHGWYWWTATGWQKAPDAPSAISGAYNKYDQAMMAPGAATVGLVKGAAQELVHGTAKTFGNLAKFMGQTPGAPTGMTTPNLVPYGITDEYKKAYLQGANELGNDIISGNEAAEAAENKSLPSQTAAGKTGEYVGKQVGTFAKAAVGGMPLLGAETFLNRYGAVAGEGEDQTNVMKGMTAGLADATLLNVVSKIPGMTPDKVASVRGAIAKSLLLDAPLEAGVQTLGGVAIDKLVLDKNVSTSDVVDSYLHNLAAFAGFKAMGLKEVVKAERANSDWINENIGKNFSSYEDAKTNIAAFISEVSKDATQEPTPQKMAAIDAARQSLAILEKAEKSGRRIKWAEPETAAATTVKPTETSTNTQERLAQPTEAIAPQETAIAEQAKPTEVPSAIQEQGAGEMGAQPRGTEGVGEQAGGVRPSEQVVEPARAQVGPEVAKPEVLAQGEEGKVANHPEIPESSPKAVMARVATKLLKPVSGHIPDKIKDIKGLLPSGEDFTIPVSELSADPTRFQYKGRNETTGVNQINKETGASGALAGVKVWNKESAGTVSVWRDPADGKVYVVNGHNRYDLAQRLGVKRMKVRFIDANNAAEAKNVGAIQNIASGKGTAMDAATLFRDGGYKTEDLERIGIPTQKGVVTNGLALSDLSGQWFEAAKSDPDIERLAVETGKAGLSKEQHGMALQELHTILQKKGAEDISSPFWRDMLDRIKGSQVRTSAEGGLFGEEESYQSTLEQQTDLIRFIRSKLRTDKTVGNVLTGGRYEESVGKAATVNKEAAAGIKQNAVSNLGMFESMKHLAGVGDVINDYAYRLSQAHSNKEAESIRHEALSSVKDSIKEMQGGNKPVNLDSNEPMLLADTFGAQHVYEHLVEKMGLPKDATVGDIAGYTFGKIKTLGKNVAETTAKIITQIKGITRDAASRLAQILHDNFSSNGKRKGERGAIAFGGDVEAGRSRSWYDLDKASKDDVVSVIRKSVDEYSASPERAVEDYKKIPDSRDGRIVSGDASRLLHEGYAQNPNWGGGAFGQLGDGYLNKEMAINKSLRDYAIKRSAEEGKDGAIMVGGQGSGKTTLSKELIDSNGNIGVVLDGLHMDKDEIHFLAEKMKREGVYPHVIMVDTPPERAFKNTLVRSESEIRHVNPDFFIKAHDRASKGFLDYADGNPKDVTLHRASSDGKSFSLTRGAEAVDAIRAEKRLSPEELAESVRKTYLEAKENGRVRSDVARSIEAGSESIGARGSETARGEDAEGNRGLGQPAREELPEENGTGGRMGREEIKTLVNDFYAGDINKYNRASVYRDENFWQSKTPEEVNERLLTHSESKLDVTDPQFLADTFGGQQVYERITKKMGLPEDASLRHIGEFTMGKIKSLGKTVAETTNKILSRVAGIGREAASRLAHFLHNEWENFKKRNGEEGAVRLDNPFFKKMMTEGGASEVAGMAKNLGAKPEAEKPEAIERKVDNYTQALDFGNPERGSVGIGDAKEVAKGIANIATATPKKAASTFSKLGNFVDESARRSMLATKKSVSKLSPKAETELVKVARQLDKAGLLQHRVSPDATELPKGAGRIIDYQTPKVVKDIKAGISGKVQSMSWMDQHVFGKGQGGFAPDIYTQANRGAINAANFTDVKDNILKQNGIRDNGAEIEKLMNKPDASLGGKSIGEVLQQHLKTVHEYENPLAEMEAKAEKQQYGDMQEAIDRFKTDNAPVYEKAKKLTEAAFRLGAKRVNESIALYPEARVFMLAQTDPEAIKKAHGSLEFLSQKNNLTLDESRELENAKMLVKLDKLAKPNERKAAEGFRKMMDEIGSMLEDAGVSAKEPYYMPHTMLKGMKVDPMAPDDLIESLNYAKRTGNVTLMPSVNVALDRYLPNAARKISMQPVLDKWTAAINPDQPGSLTDPLAENRAENYAARIKDTLLEMQTPSDNDIFSKAFKFQRNFEVRKAIGLSIRTAIKHATKMVEISNEHGVHMAPGAKDVLIGATGDVLDAYANERGFTGNMVRKALVPVRNMLGVSELDAQQTAQFARNFLATAEMRKMMNEDPSSMEFAYSLNPHLAPASRGVTRSIGRGWGKLKNALGQPVSAVEALENFVNMASSIEKGGTHGLNQDQNIKAMIGNILAYDYKPHTDTPAVYRGKAARLLTAFTTTPHKNMELFSHMIARGLRGERDIYGTSETSKMIRDMVAIGAVTAGASQIGWHFLHDKFHAPLVNMDWWEHAAKYGYNKFTGDDEQSSRELEAMQGNQDGPVTFFTPSESLMDMYRVLNTGDVMAPLKQSTAWKEYLAVVHGELPSSYETMSDYFLGNKTEESEARQEKFEVNKGKKQQMSHIRSNQRNTPQ